MSRSLVVACMIGGAVFLIGAALIYDRSSALEKEAATALQISEQLSRYREAALVSAQTLMQGDPALREAAEAYRAVPDERGKQQAFLKIKALVDGFLIKNADAESQIQRRVIDEFNGALNRSERALPLYEESRARYQAKAAGILGGVARHFTGGDAP